MSARAAQSDAAKPTIAASANIGMDIAFSPNAGSGTAPSAGALEYAIPEPAKPAKLHQRNAAAANDTPEAASPKAFAPLFPKNGKNTARTAAAASGA